MKLTQAVFTARGQGSALDPEAAETVAQMAGLPAPFGAVGTFLEAVASGGPIPPVPEGLPSEVASILEKLKE